jgi:hypothetical protein
VGARRSCSCGVCRKCKDRIRKKAQYDAMTIEEKRAKAARRDPVKRMLSQQRARKRQEARNADKIKARKAVQHALRAGKLVRPHRCEGCGLRKKVEAHHPDYKKPLIVKWLCSPCHKQRHRDAGGTGL